MTKFFVGDVVRVVNSEAYPKLNGLMFDVIGGGGDCTTIDVTALSATTDKYGWGRKDGSRVWYMKSSELTLVVPAKGVKRSDTTKRDTPLPDKALSPQCQKLISLLRAKGSVTALEAGGVHRIRALPRRIADLKEAGYSIARDLTTDVTGQRYARYYLKGQVEAIAA